MPSHGRAIQKLCEAGHKDFVEYVQTLEAHNQLLQEELERVLKLLVEQSVTGQLSNVAEKADAVLKYTREYSSRQH